LEQRQAWELAQSEVHRQILGGLARLLPAFGLIGTLIGMVQLLANLASVHHKTLPAALSLSVLTTLYGALTANMVVAPLAARLQTLATEKAAKMALTRDWLLTLARGDISSVPVQQKSLASRQEAVLPLLSEWQPAALATQRMTREAATH
jgi:chemotaxis protein MotA